MKTIEIIDALNYDDNIYIKIKKDHKTYDEKLIKWPHKNMINLDDILKGNISKRELKWC